MLPELAVLKYLLSYERFQKYSMYVSIPEDMRELVKVWHSLQLLHKKYPDSDKTLAELMTMVVSCYPNLREIEKDAIASLFHQLETVEVRDEILQDLLRNVRSRHTTRALAVAAFEVSEGRGSVEGLQTLYESVVQPSEAGPLWANSRNFVTDDLYELEQRTVKSPGVNWRLNCLRRSLGPIRAGTFGFVFARPESGKTTFIADQTAYFAEQTDRPIIWFTNEEEGELKRLRSVQACLSLTQDEVWANKQHNLEEYRNRTKGLIRLYDDVAIHKSEVEAVVTEMCPSVIVFDQIDKIRGFDADRPDIVYGRLYQWARELAKRHQMAVIGICQSDGTGEGIKWLTMSHVAEAKTSKQAEADWILGIGRSNESGVENIRFFNISKNKLLGDEHTDPNERHGRFEVYMRPMISRYEDLD